jgi:predicted phosphodiesterase
MTTFQIASDLHIEEIVLDDNEEIDIFSMIKPSADVLILAGDIGSLYKVDQLFNFIRDCSMYFKHVVYVLGNHEFYFLNGMKNKKTFVELLEVVDDLKLKLESFNVSILQRNSIQIDNLVIAGCTLWSSVLNSYGSEMMDNRLFNKIVKIWENDSQITQSFFHQMHLKDLDFIVKTTAYCETNKLDLFVVTHHVPSHSLSMTKNENVRCLYSTNLEYLLQKTNINTWICGHTHNNFDICIISTRIVSNQKGKNHEDQNNFSFSFVL